ncbi:MAG: HipA domain-containing protein [Eggerthellaceae bacterium]|nr:HipA domain-containing protein [Eggerthellaceae bacterium]
MRTLEVYLGDELVGHLRETRRGARFAYTPEVVERYPGSPVLSLALPAKSRPFGEATTRNWFEGLLPEGRRRDEVCRNLGIDTNDWVGLLAEIGWECAGAVKVIPEGEAVLHEAGYTPLPSEALATRLAALGKNEPRPQVGPYRMSLDGFQNKLVVCMPRLKDGGGILTAADLGEVFLPGGDAASTHILKPEDTGNHPGAAEGEAWALMAAASAARSSKAALLLLDGVSPTLAVERFDRAGDNWPYGVERIHQEDACQALNLPSFRKYAREGGPKGDDPTYRAIADLLRRFAKRPAEELAELLRQLVVNLSLGNWDAHAKNIAFLFERPMVATLAPMYDLVPVAEIEPRTDVLSLRVAGKLDPAEISRQDIIEEACNWGMAEDDAKAVIGETLSGLEEGLSAAARSYPAAAERHEDASRERIARLRG